MAGATAVDARDQKLGAEVVKAGLATEAQVSECLRARAKAAEAGEPQRSLAEHLLEKGYVDDAKAREVAKLAAQQKAQAFAAAGETKRREKPSSPEKAAAAGKDAPPPGAGGKAAEIARMKIPGYEILDLLGKGGMGSVYKARQKSLDRIVALKVLAPDIARDETYLKRFTTEARALARLNHENIIAGIDVGEANGYRYFAMEYVEGDSLATLIEREGPLGEKRALTIAMQVARALSHADKSGLVHRDVKPQNVMIGRNDVAKLCDLGLAMTADERKEARERGQSVGTPHYISPEQARGEHRVDIRSDIYSLGATLYHAVTGETPFSGSSPMVLMTKHLTEDPAPPRKRNPKVGKALDALIMKMLAKEKEKRYQTPIELLEDMERVLAGRGIEGAAAGSGGGARAAQKPGRPARPGTPGKARAAAGSGAKRRPSREHDDDDAPEGDEEEEEQPRWVRKKSDPTVMGLISLGGLLVSLLIAYLIWSSNQNRPEVGPPPPSEEAEQRAKESLQNLRSAFARKDIDKFGAIRYVDELVGKFNRTAAALEAAQWRKVLEKMQLEPEVDQTAAPPAGGDEESGPPPRAPPRPEGEGPREEPSADEKAKTAPKGG